MTFRELTTCTSAVQAELIVSILQENGMPAFTNAGESNVTLSHMQIAMRAISVFVAPEQFDHAKKLLEGLSDNSGEPWYCGNCQLEIEAGFDVCWSCGRPREEVQAPFPAKPPLAEQTLAPKLFIEQPDTANPYSPPIAPVSIDEEADPTPDQLRAEDLIRRAWTASILGLFFLPVLMQFYSMYLLIVAGTIDAPLSQQSQKRYNRSLILNIVGIAIMSLFIKVLWF